MGVRARFSGSELRPFSTYHDLVAFRLGARERAFCPFTSVKVEEFDCLSTYFLLLETEGGTQDPESRCTDVNERFAEVRHILTQGVKALGVR